MKQNNSNFKFPYINRLIDRLCDNKKTYLNDSFTYYNRYNVNVQCGTKDIMCITITDKTMDDKLIADFDFDCWIVKVSFNYTYSKTLEKQIIKAFTILYEPTIPINFISNNNL